MISTSGRSLCKNISGAFRIDSVEVKGDYDLGMRMRCSEPEQVIGNFDMNIMNTFNNGD